MHAPFRHFSGTLIPWFAKLRWNLLRILRKVLSFRLTFKKVLFTYIESISTFFRQYSHFIPTGNTRKPKVFWFSQGHEMGVLDIRLTHLFPMHTFSKPWKYQKTVKFSDIFRVKRKGALGRNGLKCWSITIYMIGIHPHIGLPRNFLSW